MIYIVGGNGFVGSAFARKCKEKSLDYQIITRENANDFYHTKCDILINANGNSKKYMADQAPVWEFDASVRSVYEYLVNIKYGKYVQLSSCDVYPDCSNYEATMENSEIDITKQSAYGFHKLMAEQCVRYYADEWLIFRMGGFVGEGLRKNAIFDILNGGPLFLHPESELQFISTDCAADIILGLAMGKTKNEIFNLCGNGIIKLQDVMDYVGFVGEIKENAPLVKYEVNINKLSKVCEIESAEDAVFSFIACREDA